jgi:C_GCAxxG_C_C family probable redox protein
MNNVEKAVENFQAGFNCSQAVFAAYAEYLGLSEDNALKIAAGFGGGMRMAGACGALTGAFMAIGLKYGATDAKDQSSKMKTYELIEKATAMFRERNSSVLCRELLDCDISTPEGRTTASQKGLFKKICPKLVRDAAEIVEEILNED